MERTRTEVLPGHADPGAKTMLPTSMQAADVSRGAVRPRWYALRWRFLLVLLVVAGALVARTVWRQFWQQQAMHVLNAWNVPYRAQPVAPPASWWLPPGLDEQVVELYWRDPALDEQKLAEVLFPALLAPLDTVEKLELSTSPLTARGLRTIARLPRLDTLHLDGTGVTDQGLAELVRLNELRILSLDDTRITDAGLSRLTRLTKLERLSLNGTQVTDAGLAQLASLTRLKELSLVGTQITDAGLVHLAQLTNLELLKVHNTQVTLQGMQQLHQALPQCVIWLPSE